MWPGLHPVIKGAQGPLTWGSRERGETEVMKSQEAQHELPTINK